MRSVATLIPTGPPAPALVDAPLPATWFIRLESSTRRGRDNSLALYWRAVQLIREHPVRLVSVVAVGNVGFTWYGHLIFYSAFGVTPVEAGVSYDRLLLRSGAAAGFLVVYIASVSIAALLLHFAIGLIAKNAILRLLLLFPVSIAVYFLIALFDWPPISSTIFSTVSTISVSVSLVSLVLAQETPRIELIITPLMATGLIIGVMASSLLTEPSAMAQQVRNGESLSVSDNLFFDVQGQRVTVEGGPEPIDAMLIGQSDGNYLLYEVDTETLIRLAKEGVVLRQSTQ